MVWYLLQQKLSSAEPHIFDCSRHNKTTYPWEAPVVKIACDEKKNEKKTQVSHGYFLQGLVLTSNSHSPMSRKQPT
jgi:hypothetical protein